ncbi:MAG: mismatch repair protein MutS [Chitinophagaceae bacterium]|nr:mismatch repair protein MutS [Chitinophagaceae bacterium]MDB5222655.1 mismatch repair protein MutS [Chitinophagaceae bacterium]
MEIDKTTLNDLSIFNHEEEFSIFNKLDLTRTMGGREKLRQFFSKSLTTIEAIRGIQQTIEIIRKNLHSWPEIISNGSIMVIHKFYETGIDQIPAGASAAAAYAYKLFHTHDFSLVKYSTGHAFDFIKGMRSLIATFLNDECPAPLKKILQRAENIIDKGQFAITQKKEKPNDLSMTEMLRLAYFLRYHYKHNIFELTEIYAQIDAWYGMAMAMDKYDLVFPEFIESDTPIVRASALYHILLPHPVSYDITLDQQNNFLFLTGANMAGKSTFIKSVGAAVFLAHIGMGVPAQALQLSLFDGVLSNINVVDNLSKGESYFYNEVQRVKDTILKINDGRKWLILIDELFKGTNVQDAMKCSTVVIEGLIKVKQSLFILSTHLYEIGEALKEHNNIVFKYFETTVDDEQLKFSYQLKEGISNDRLGYLILKREKVIDLLEKL